MKNKVAKYIFSVGFALLLFIGSLPMDFIHQFAGHKDTIHKTHKGLVIEKKHHHCGYLSLTLASFVNDVRLPDVHASATAYFRRPHPEIAANFVQRHIIASEMRGPPVV